mmetsp:Transcript_16775/g.30986  ORF Transcript_16775/g.30986 Transcript_16775/m.30986 type:complete len:358 (-) Transcript_16775:97-1170(-)
MAAKRPRESSSGYPAAPARGGIAPKGVATGIAKDEQSYVRLTPEGPANPDTKDFCGAFASLDIDNSWDHSVFKRGFSLNITQLTDEVVEFDMAGIDPPLANAFRRILIAEVPTVAISRVTIYQNTGVIHDENLAHRLGLVPIHFEPDNLRWRGTDADFNEENSLMFKLRKVCEQDKVSVYSRDLKWVPWSDDQAQRFQDDPPRPVADDILIAQLRSGQEIECECHLEKGLGKEHAKWSPVCTAHYRLLPELRLARPIAKEAREHTQASSMSIFDVEETDDTKRAVATKPRACSTSRESLENFPGDEGSLQLVKAKNHYIFTIESVGCVPAPLLFERALQKLRDKCETAKNVLAVRSK